MENYNLQMKNIRKSFNNVEVLKGVNLEVKKGEIHALLGENGAGKSTLMNILGGVIKPTDGEILIDEENVNITEPRDSQHLGIGFIHQELNIVGDLKVYENMFLGSEIRNKFGFLDVKAMCEKTAEILHKIGVEIDPRAYASDLGTSYKQVIEIARALLADSKIIIMDEPTTSLTDYEINNLFKLMRTLQDSGVTFIYISHKLTEVFDICNRYTVLRDGTLAGNGETKHVDEEEITRLMVGKSVSNIEYFVPRNIEKPVLIVRNLNDKINYHNISFTVHKGEILGFTGLAGDGRTELFESIFGFHKNYTGKIEVNGKPIKINHPQKALLSGIGLVPKNRKENAIIKDMNVIQNLTLSSLNHFENKFLIKSKSERQSFEQFKDKLNIKVHDPLVTIDTLSGGNQQKVVLAKWLEVNTDVIIFDNPTQGIDVGAKSEIYQLIMELANQGKAIIILSSEAPEILKLCDNINVMFQGEITARLSREKATEETIMMYATGAKREETVNE